MELKLGMLVMIPVGVDYDADSEARTQDRKFRLMFGKYGSFLGKDVRYLMIKEE